jgi:hypothetical protein
MKFHSKMAWLKIDNVNALRSGGVVLETNKHLPQAQVRVLISRMPHCSKGITLHFTRRLDWWVDFLWASIKLVENAKFSKFIYTLFTIFVVVFWVYKELYYIYNLQIKISPEIFIIIIII